MPKHKADQTFLSDCFEGRFWMGLRKETEQWSWSDGEALTDQTDWGPGQPRTDQASPWTCVSLRTTFDDPYNYNGWYTTPCNWDINKILCQASKCRKLLQTHFKCEADSLYCLCTAINTITYIL